MLYPNRIQDQLFLLLRRNVTYAAKKSETRTNLYYRIKKRCIELGMNPNEPSHPKILCQN